MVGIGPSGKGRRDMQERNESRWLDVSFPELGHSMIAFLRAARRAHRARVPGRAGGGRLLPALRGGAQAAAGRSTGASSAGPARSSRTPRRWRASRARSRSGTRAARTRRRCGAGTSSTPTRRAEVKDFLRHYYIRYSGPSGLTEQDDMENWNYAHAASRGTIARRIPTTTRWAWAARRAASRTTGSCCRARSAT